MHSISFPTFVNPLAKLLAIATLTFVFAFGHSADAATPAAFVQPKAKPSTAASWPRNFSMVYCWGTMNPNDITAYCPCADLTLYRRPRTVDVFDCSTGMFHPGAGSWSKTRRWNEVTFDFPGLVTYTGTKQPDGSYEGVMFTPNGMFGVWRGEFN